jgi:acetyl esterase/lipase
MEYVNALKAAGQEVYYVKVPGAAHAYYDWKPDATTKATFDRFGAPFAHQMEQFFNTVFYR